MTSDESAEPYLRFCARGRLVAHETTSEGRIQKTVAAPDLAVYSSPAEHWRPSVQVKILQNAAGNRREGGRGPASARSGGESAQRLYPCLFHGSRRGDSDQHGDPQEPRRRAVDEGLVQGRRHGSKGRPAGRNRLAALSSP